MNPMKDKIAQHENENGLAYEVCDIRIDIEAEIYIKAASYKTMWYINRSFNYVHSTGVW